MQKELFTSFDLSDSYGQPDEVALKVSDTILSDAAAVALVRVVAARSLFWCWCALPSPQVNLPYLLESLLVYGINALVTTTVELTYDSGTGVLSMLLEDKGIVTEVLIRTVDMSAGAEGGAAADNAAEYEGAFRRHDVLAKTVMNSDTLHDAIKEIAEQRTGREDMSVTLVMGNASPQFRLHANSDIGSLTIDVPSSSEVFLSFEVVSDVCHAYSAKLLEASLRALSEATQTYLRINARGMLSMSHKLRVSSDGVEERAAYITFTIMPSDVEESADRADAALESSAVADEEQNDEDSRMYDEENQNDDTNADEGDESGGDLRRRQREFATTSATSAERAERRAKARQYTSFSTHGGTEGDDSRLGESRISANDSRGSGGRAGRVSL